MTITIKRDVNGNGSIHTETKVAARMPSPTITESKSFDEVINDLDETLESCLQSIEDQSMLDRIVTQEPVPPRSREETPDYIPIPVREKFHVLRIDEDEVEKPAVKVEEARTEEKIDRFVVQPVQTEEKIERFVVETVRTEKVEPVKVKPVPAPKPAQRVKVESSPIVAPPRTHRHHYEEISVVTTQHPEEIFKKVELKPKSPQPSSPPSRETFLKFEEIERKTKEVESTLKAPEQKKVREETPVPMANTEIVEKLTSQGFIRTEQPIRFYEDIETVIRKKDYSFDDDISGEPPVPPERRRSVKDIIESINRNQKLLKMNQPPTPTMQRKFSYGSLSYHEKPAVPPKDNVMAKLHRQTSDSERRINELLDDLQNYTRGPDTVKKPMEFPCNNNDADHANFNKTQSSHDYLR